jgi:hypothetical protein
MLILLLALLLRTTQVSIPIMPLDFMAGEENFVEVETETDLITVLEIQHVRFASNEVIMLPIAIIILTYDIIVHLRLKIKFHHNTKPFLLSHCLQLLNYLP